MKQIALPTILVICLSLSCKEQEVSPQAPDKTDTNLISNGSFEQSGTPTRNGWTGWNETDTSLARYYTFSEDTPPDGGKWSLAIENPYTTNLWVTTDVSIPGPFHEHKLTVWAKTIGLQCQISLLVSATGVSGAIGQYVTVQDSVWREYTISTIGLLDSLSSTYPDSTRILRIKLKVWRDPLHQGKTLFDLARLERTN